jgi:hypothetical protein
MDIIFGGFEGQMKLSCSLLRLLAVSGGMDGTENTPERDATPLGLVCVLSILPQGSPSFATLGFAERNPVRIQGVRANLLAVFFYR